MGQRVDVDNLLDAAAVAEQLGLTHRNSVATYRARYPDFPAPLIEPCDGKCPLWRRSDVVRWARQRGAVQRPR